MAEELGPERGLGASDALAPLLRVGGAARATLAAIGPGAPTARRRLDAGAGYLRVRILGADVGGAAVLIVARASGGQAGAALATPSGAAAPGFFGDVILAGAPVGAALEVEAAFVALGDIDAARPALDAMRAAAEGLAGGASAADAAARAPQFAALGSGMAALSDRAGARGAAWRAVRFEPIYAGAVALLGGPTARTPARAFSGALRFDAASGRLSQPDGAPVEGPWVALVVDPLATHPLIAAAPEPAAAWRALAAAAARGVSSEALAPLREAYREAVSAAPDLAPSDRRALVAAAEDAWSALAAAPAQAWPSHAGLAAALAPTLGAGRLSTLSRAAPPSFDEAGEAIWSATRSGDATALDAALDGLARRAILAGSAEHPAAPGAFAALLGAGALDRAEALADALAVSALETATSARARAEAALRRDPASAATAQAVARAQVAAAWDGEGAAPADRLAARAAGARMRAALARTADRDGLAALLGDGGAAEIEVEVEALAALQAFTRAEAVLTPLDRALRLSILIAAGTRRLSAPGAPRLRAAAEASLGASAGDRAERLVEIAAAERALGRAHAAVAAVDALIESRAAAALGALHAMADGFWPEPAKDAAALRAALGALALGAPGATFSAASLRALRDALSRGAASANAPSAASKKGAGGRLAARLFGRASAAEAGGAPPSEAAAVCAERLAAAQALAVATLGGARVGGAVLLGDPLGEPGVAMALLPTHIVGARAEAVRLIAADRPAARAAGALWRAPTHGGHGLTLLAVPTPPPGAQPAAALRVCAAPPQVGDALLALWATAEGGLRAEPATALFVDAGDEADAPARLGYRLGAAAPAGAAILDAATLELVALHLADAGDALSAEAGFGAAALEASMGAVVAPALAAAVAFRQPAATAEARAPSAAASPGDRAVPQAAMQDASAPSALAAARRRAHSAPEAARELSEEALGIMLDCAGGGRRRYAQALARPLWPGDSGGVRVGLGYDLGAATAAEIARDWGGALDEVDVSLLQTAAGLTAATHGGAKLRRLARALGAVEVGYDAAVAVFRAAQAPAAVALAEERFGSATAELHRHSFGALASLAWSVGAAPFAELNAIRGHLASGRADLAPSEIRALKARAPRPDGDRPSLADRREREAALFERGLALAATAPSWRPAVALDAAEREGAGAVLAEPPHASESLEPHRWLQDRDDAAAPDLGATLEPALAAWRAAGRPAPRFESDALNPDLAHLTEAPFDGLDLGDSAFTLTADLLARALRLSGVDVAALAGAGGVALFGLRGARPAEGEACWTRAAFVDGLRLVETTPDCRRLNCMIGAWDVATGGLWAAPGSTVPSAPLVYERARRVAAGEAGAELGLAHLLPTGVYRMAVGAVGGAAPQPGAFRFDTAAALRLRAVGVDPMVFSAREGWDGRALPGADHLTAARFAGAPELDFLSAGGMTVRGTYRVGERGAQPTDCFARLRIMAGLAHPMRYRAPLATEDDAAAGGAGGGRYAFALLASRELRAAAALTAEQALDPSFAWLRLGASGDRVAALQRGLGLPENAVDGVFGFATHSALAARQVEVQGFATGVAGPALLRQLGVA